MIKHWCKRRSVLQGRTYWILILSPWYWHCTTLCRYNKKAWWGQRTQGRLRPQTTSTMSRQVTGSSEDTEEEEMMMKCLDELPGLREIDAALDEVSPPLATHATE